MTHNFDVLDCLIESLWHYGIPPPPLAPPSCPPTSAPAQIIGFSTASIPSNYILCTDRDSFGSPMALPDQLADAATLHAGSLPRLFNVLDEDGDGRLSLRDMRSLVARLGMSSDADHRFLSLIHSTLSCNNNIPQHQQIIKSSTHDEYLLPSLDFPQFSQLYASLFAADPVQLLADCQQLIENPAHDQDAHHDHGIDIHDEDLLDAFQVYDTNRDGFISAAELAAVLLELRLLPTAAGGGGRDEHRSIDAHNILGKCQAYIDSVDLDGNGMVDLQEFKAMMNMHNNIALTAAA